MSPQQKLQQSSPVPKIYRCPDRSPSLKNLPTTKNGPSSQKVAMFGKPGVVAIPNIGMVALLSVDSSSITTGTNMAQYATTGSSDDNHNNGLEEEEVSAHHTFQVREYTFTVDRRYSFKKMLGRGTFGIVIAAYDRPDGPHSGNFSCVAIKNICNAFGDVASAKGALREIQILKHCQGHENIIQLIDLMVYPGIQSLDARTASVYLITDLMDMDLSRLLYNTNQPLPLVHIQWYIFQALRGLSHIHDAHVIHRDIKPQNLLIRRDGKLKICDFGLARGIPYPVGEYDSQRHGYRFTPTVGTHCYRAPEMLLTNGKYSYPSDVWSMGCTFAELIMKKVMFKGEDTSAAHQLAAIFRKLGKPKKTELDFVTMPNRISFVQGFPEVAPPPEFSTLFSQGTDANALLLLRRMLAWHPRDRITVEAALEHDFFHPYHNDNDTTTLIQPWVFPYREVDVSGFCFDESDSDECDVEYNQAMMCHKYQELIWQETGAFRPSCTGYFLPMLPP